MNYLLKTTLIGLFFGTFGTTIGGIIGVSIKNTSNKFLSFILSFASGLMLSIVCFDLVPESMRITSISNTIIGILLGVACMIACDIAVAKLFRKKNDVAVTNNNLLKTGIIVSIGLALHNLPEGLAIGSSFEASIKLGYSLALAICLHDIPEGISMGVPMKNGGMKKIKGYFLCIYVWGYDWNRSFFRITNWWNIRCCNSNVLSICRRSNALHCIWRVNTRIK